VKKTYLSLAIVGVALVALAALAANAFADGTASSKATAAINTAVGCKLATQTTIGDTVPGDCHDIFTGVSVPMSVDNFVTIMSNTIKVSNSQSLFVSPSLVTGLYTDTKVKTTSGTTGSTSVATAEGGVFLRAIVANQATGQVVVGYPVALCTADLTGCSPDASGTFGVTLDSRVQSLSQTLSACVVNVTVGGISGSGTCSFDSTIDLILKTTSAHTFNFIFPNVGVGTYTVQIQAAVNANATVTGSGTAVSAAAFGLGSVTVESVRLVHDFSF
jgi:hypothetical protein